MSTYDLLVGQPLRAMGPNREGPTNTAANSQSQDSVDSARIHLHARKFCPIYALNLRDRIQIHTIEEFLGAGTRPSQFLRRMKPRNRTISAGETAYPLPTSERALIFVSRGEIELFIDCHTVPQVIRRVGPGMIFGEAPLLRISMFGAKAKALVQSELKILPPAKAESAVLDSLPLCSRWLRQSASRWCDLEEGELSLIFESVRQRLARELLRRANTQGLVSGVNQVEIAGKLGVYRETVSARLSEMQAAGIIRVSRQSIVILSPGRLRNLVLHDKEGMTQ